MKAEEKVILVDANDVPTGTMEKLEAHRRGVLHRAFSVFIFNSKSEMLLQQRAGEKYHSGGLWSNACCSHPRPGEETAAAAKRRLYEEMGLNAELEFKTSFIYQAQFPNGLSEHELDHVYTGRTDDQPKPDPTEVKNYKWINLSEIRREIAANPENFTKWFRIAMEKIF